MSRRRYRYDAELKQLVEVGAEWSDKPPVCHPTEELIYGGAAVQTVKVGEDGQARPEMELINTRKKHREYMRRNGLTTVDDFPKTWERAQAERDSMRDGSGKFDTAARREAIGRAIYKLTEGRRRK